MSVRPAGLLGAIDRYIHIGVDGAGPAERRGHEVMNFVALTATPVFHRLGPLGGRHPDWATALAGNILHPSSPARSVVEDRMQRVRIKPPQFFERLHRVFEKLWTLGRLGYLIVLKVSQSGVYKMNKEQFYNTMQAKFGSISNAVHSGLDLIIAEAEKRRTPVNHVAYILATAWWETAKTMQPVREAFYISSDFSKVEKWRKKNLHYYPYYGRGFVQLTWRANYEKASRKFGRDFISNPDEVMEPQFAVPIIFDGMAEGWFTGKSLDDYIDDIDEPGSADLQEYKAARRIINGTDKADTVAVIAVAFEQALKDGAYSQSAAPLSITIGGVASLAGPSTSIAPQFDAHITSLNLRHFKPYEFLVKGGQNDDSSSPAYRLNTDPPQSLWSNIDPTARVIDELRDRLGRSIVLSSVYRSPAYNDAIGGAGDSQHTHFRAIDFAVRGSPVGPSEWAGALREMRSSGMFQGGIGVYSTFVHVDTRGTNVDWNG